MQDIDSMLTLIIAGFVLLSVGFNFREQQWGMCLLTLGILSMLSTLFYKLHVTFN